MRSQKRTGRELDSIWALSFGFCVTDCDLRRFHWLRSFLQSNFLCFCRSLASKAGEVFQWLEFAGSSGDRVRWNGSGMELMNSVWQLDFCDLQWRESAKGFTVSHSNGHQYYRFPWNLTESKARIPWRPVHRLPDYPSSDCVRHSFPDLILHAFETIANLQANRDFPAFFSQRPRKEHSINCLTEYKKFCNRHLLTRGRLR
jgi:hypothetical protein